MFPVFLIIYEQSLFTSIWIHFLMIVTQVLKLKDKDGTVEIVQDIWGSRTILSKINKQLICTQSKSLFKTSISKI